MLFSAPATHDLRAFIWQLSFAVCGLAVDLCIHCVSRHLPGSAFRRACDGGAALPSGGCCGIAVLMGMLLIVPAPIRRQAPRVAVIAAVLHLILATMLRFLNVVHFSYGLCCRLCIQRLRTGLGFGI